MFKSSRESLQVWMLLSIVTFLSRSFDKWCKKCLSQSKCLHSCFHLCKFNSALITLMTLLANNVWRYLFTSWFQGFTGVLSFCFRQIYNLVLYLTRMRRQSDEKSWWAGMVENTERTKQLNTKMNLKHQRRHSETGDTHRWTGWHQRSDLCNHIMTTFPTVTNMPLSIERALTWKWMLYFPLLQTLEPILATEAEPEQKNLAAQSHN